MDDDYLDMYLDYSEMLQEAQDENAKLRDELDAVKHDLSLFSERIVELGAENAKLRELVRCLVYATNPLDRATLIANAAEMGIKVEE